MKSGRTRRELLFGLGGGGLLERLDAGLPEQQRQGWRSANPPLGRPILPAGIEAEVVALLGPVGGGIGPLDCLFESAAVSSDRIHYFFVTPAGRVEVILAAKEAPAEGLAVGGTSSFSIWAQGEAPEALRRAVAERVRAEVELRDRGQLWRAPGRGGSSP